MAAQGFMSEEDNKKFFIQLMSDEDKKQLESFKHSRTDAGHANKRYIVYKHDSSSESGVKPILAVKVTDFAVDLTKGISITLENEIDGDVMIVGHIPVRLFNTDVYLYAPLYQRLKYETFAAVDKHRPHSLAFSIGVVTASRSNHKKDGDTFCETLTELAKLYPDVTITI